jgi:hypothetical protein
MGMAIYLSYFLLEVVMLIRITILNRFNRFSITSEETRKLFSNGWTVTGLESDERGEVVYRHTSLNSDVIWNNVNQDEDEVNLLVRISN